MVRATQGNRVVNLAPEDLDSGTISCTNSDLGQNAYMLSLRVLIYKNGIFKNLCLKIMYASTS